MARKPRIPDQKVQDYIDGRLNETDEAAMEVLQNFLSPATRPRSPRASLDRIEGGRVCQKRVLPKRRE